MRLRARDDQHGADRAVPRRRPAGGDVRDGAAARHRGAAAEDRPGRAAPPQPDRARQAAAPHRRPASPTTAATSPAISRARSRSPTGTASPTRRTEAKKRGRLLGIGVANYVETPVGMPHERVTVTVLARRRRSHRRHAVERAGPRDQLPAGDGRPARRRRRTRSTSSAATARRLASGGGTHSDRSMRLAGSLMVETSRTIVGKARRIAAALLDVSESTTSTFDDGLFSAPNSNRRLSLFDIARAIADRPDLPDDLRAPLGAEATFTGRIPAYPTGAAVCEVEVDPDTGAIEISPLHLDRRRRPGDQSADPARPGARRRGAGRRPGDAGGDGLGARRSGQMLSASFLDYAHAARRPLSASCDIDLTEDPDRGRATRCASRAAARPASRRARPR